MSILRPSETACGLPQQRYSATTVNLDGYIDMTAVMGAGLTFNSASNVYESNSPFPTFTSHFTVDHWDVGAAGAPDVNFADVTLDIGGIGRFFCDTFGDVIDLLEPLEPIIDFFTSPTPLIKDIPPLDALLKAFRTLAKIRRLISSMLINRCAATTSTRFPSRRCLDAAEADHRLR